MRAPSRPRDAGQHERAHRPFPFQTPDRLQAPYAFALGSDPIFAQNSSKPVAAELKFDETALIQRLLTGDQSAWSEFVARYSAAIFGAVINTLRKAGFNPDEGVDIAQDVYVRLCKDDCRLLRQFDARRASVRTWLGVVASSTTIDYLRRNRRQGVSLDDVPEEVYRVDPKTPETVKIPPGLLSERQALVLRLLYDRDMDAAEVANLLGIDSQTVRSTHHKALVKLRKYFAGEDG
jgi:RNA polymerase sigma-70 factor (ECF subfamily)